MAGDKYFASHTAHAAERERLNLLESALDPGSTRHLEALGVSRGWNCLEVGGGGGSIARGLSEKVGPNGRVVVVDIDTRFLREIRRANVEVRQQDIGRDAIEDSKYDLAHCRFLLTHLSQRDMALSRMIGALKVGGWVMIEEPDFSSYEAADPSHPLSEAFTRQVRGVFERVTQSGLFDPYLGRRTRALLESAGLTQVGAEGTAWLWRGGEAEARAHQLSLPALIRAGVCSEEDANDIERALTDPGFTFVGYTVFSAWGRRSNPGM
jgi:SAM-dependent methyltransferase